MDPDPRLQNPGFKYSFMKPKADPKADPRAKIPGSKNF